MPDGFVVNFPDDMPRSQIVQAIQDSQFRVNENERLKKEEEIERKRNEVGIAGAFGRGLSRGMTQTAGLLFDGLPALVGKGLGAEEYYNKQIDEYNARMEKMEEERPSLVPSYKDIDSVSDAAKYGLETVGMLAPSLATSILGGGVGAVAAKQGIKQLLKKGLVKEAGAVAKNAQAIGNIGGAFAGSGVQTIPEAFLTLEQETGDASVGASLLVGSFNAALDSIVPAAFLSRLGKGGREELAKGMLVRSLQKLGTTQAKTKKSAMAQQALKSGIVEGITEGLQQTTQVSAARLLDDNEEFFQSGDFSQILDATIRGAIGGKAFGAGAGFFTETTVQKEAREKAEKNSGLVDALEVVKEGGGFQPLLQLDFDQDTADAETQVEEIKKVKGLPNKVRTILNSKTLEAQEKLKRVASIQEALKQKVDPETKERKDREDKAIKTFERSGLSDNLIDQIIEQSRIITLDDKTPPLLQIEFNPDAVNTEAELKRVRKIATQELPLRHAMKKILDSKKISTPDKLYAFNRFIQAERARLDPKTELEKDLEAVDKVAGFEVTKKDIQLTDERPTEYKVVDLKGKDQKVPPFADLEEAKTYIQEQDKPEKFKLQNQLNDDVYNGIATKDLPPTEREVDTKTILEQRKKIMLGQPIGKRRVLSTKEAQKLLLTGQLKDSSYFEESERGVDPVETTEQQESSSAVDYIFNYYQNFPNYLEGERGLSKPEIIKALNIIKENSGQYANLIESGFDSPITRDAVLSIVREQVRATPTAQQAPTRQAFDDEVQQEQEKRVITTDSKLYRNAVKVVNNRIDEIEKRGEQGKLNADALREVLDDNKRTVGELFVAFEVADVMTKVLPEKSGHAIKFVEALKSIDKQTGELIEGTEGQVQGRRNAHAKLISLAMKTGTISKDGKVFLEFNPEILQETASHEAFHVMQDFFIQYDPQSKKILDQEFGSTNKVDTLVDYPTSKSAKWIKRTNLKLHEDLLAINTRNGGITGRELQAYAFSAYNKSRQEGKVPVMAGGLARYFRFVSSFLERLSNSFKGYGFKNAEDVFEAVATGVASKPFNNRGLQERSQDPISDLEESARAPSDDLLTGPNGQRYATDIRRSQTLLKLNNNSTTIAKIGLRKNEKKKNIVLPQGERYYSKRKEKFGGHGADIILHPSNVNLIKLNTPHNNVVSFIQDVVTNGKIERDSEGFINIRYKNPSYKQIGVVRLQQDPRDENNMNVMHAYSRDDKKLAQETARVQRQQYQKIQDRQTEQASQEDIEAYRKMRDTEESERGLRGVEAGRSVSSRMPTAKTATENAFKDFLSIDSSPVRQTPTALAKTARQLKGYNIIQEGETDGLSDNEILDLYIDRAKSNLLYIYNNIPENIRGRSRLWYEGANRIANRFARIPMESYKKNRNLTVEQTSGILAALSPQKDWFQNASLAERLIDIMTSQAGVKFTPEMAVTAKRIFGKKQYKPMLDEIKDKSLSDLEYNVATKQPYQATYRAMWIRIFDETYNDRGHRVISPEGEFLDFARRKRTKKQIKNGELGTPKATGWGSLVEIAKAVRMYENDEIDVISAELGTGHKIRSFYNNIANPLDEKGSATIDTHAVAALFLQPFSGASIPVSHNFGVMSSKTKGVEGSASVGPLGSKGMYGINYEAYVMAAREAGVLPREMQSITWEAVRGLFTPEFKTKENVAYIENVWNNYRNGKITIDQARQEVMDYANSKTETESFGRPDWDRPTDRRNEVSFDSSYKKKLLRTGISRRDRADGRTRGTDPRDVQRVTEESERGITQSKQGEYDVLEFNMDGKKVGELFLSNVRGEKEIELLQVDPEYRRMGVATALYDQAEKIGAKPSDNLTLDAYRFLKSRNPKLVKDSLYRYYDDLIGKKINSESINGEIVDVRNNNVSVRSERGGIFPLKKDALRQLNLIPEQNIYDQQISLKEERKTLKRKDVLSGLTPSEHDRRRTIEKELAEINTQLSRQVGNARSEGLKEEADTSYRLQHQPRGPQDEDPIRLDDLTISTNGEQVGYPSDFYSPRGKQLYATATGEFGIANNESYQAILKARGKPDAEVTIYRGVPNEDSITSINSGDFVTLSKKYAELHARSGYGLGGNQRGKVLSQTALVEDIYWDGNDVNEFGYFPPNPYIPYIEDSKRGYAQSWEETVVSNNDSAINNFISGMKRVFSKRDRFVGEFISSSDEFGRIEEFVSEKTIGIKKRMNVLEGAQRYMEMVMNRAGRVEMIMKYGVPVMRKDGGISFGKEKGLFQIFENYTIKEYQDWEKYAKARRAQALGDKEKFIGQKLIQDGLALENAKYKKSFDEYQKFNTGLLDFMVQAGMLDQRQRDNLAKYDYLPFYRAIEEDTYRGGMLFKSDVRGPNTTAVLNNPQPMIQKYSGGRTPIGDLAENMFRNAHALIDTAMKNKAMEKAVNLMERADMGKRVSSEQRKLLGEKGLVVSFRKNVLLKTGKVANRTIHYDITENPYAYASLAAMTPRQTDGLFKMMESLGRIFREGITHAPPFMIANLIRGDMAAFVTVDAPLVPVTDTMVGLKNAYQESETIKEMKLISGVGGYTFGDDFRDSARLLKRQMRQRNRGYNVVGDMQGFTDLIKAGWGQLTRAGEATELATREAIYRKLVDTGMSKEDAAYEALNVINFNRKGAAQTKVGVFVNSLLPLVPFLNARFQGLYRTFEPMTTGKQADRSKTIGKGLMLMAANMALYSLMSQDDRWREEPMHRKLAYHIIYPNVLGLEGVLGTEPILIPRAFEIGAIFTSIPELFVDGMTTESSEYVRDGLLHTFINTFSFNPLPQALIPAVEVASNYDFFTGRNLDTASQQRYLKSERVGPTTPEATRLLSKASQDTLSPNQISQLVEGYLGTLGGYMLTAFDVIASGMGVIPTRPTGVFGSNPIGQTAEALGFGRFRKPDPDPSNRFVGDFYDLKKEVETIYSTVNMLKRDGRVEQAFALMDKHKTKLRYRKFLLNINKKLQKINGDIRKIRLDENLSGDEKEKRLKSLIRNRNATAKQVDKILTNIRES